MAKKADPKENAAAVKASKKDNKKDAKKADAKKAETKKKGGIKKYFRDLKSEIKKVVWPSREKVVHNTGVVLAVIVLVGLFLAGTDIGLSYVANALLSIGG